ncbi:MAG: DUF4230 domain-containing protein [Saprospiraceae bacterium]|nr:DUF4230 domain-containing protein [Saprospiraceae bacterium]
MKKNYTQPLILLAVFALGAYLSWQYFKPNRHPVEESSVLLEKIEAVAKLTTVEGHFSEIYNYSEYQGFFSFFWDKKVLVRVRATVAAGYDLEAMNVEADAATKTIYMNALPEPQILSIDHSLDYYDISEGIFESFSPEDYNRINQRAKDMIREQALKSNLMTEARLQGSKMVDLLRFMVESAGWRLEIGHETVRETQQ